jgi:hypothetical protein
MTSFIVSMVALHDHFDLWQKLNYPKYEVWLSNSYLVKTLIKVGNEWTTITG